MGTTNHLSSCNLLKTCPVLKPRPQPQVPNLSLKVQIPASRPKFQSPSLIGLLDPDPSLKVQIPTPKPKFKAQGPNLSLKLQITTSRLKS